MSTHEKFRSRILDQISDWLKLLGLVVLVAEAGILTAMGLTPEGNPLHPWYPVFMLLFLAMIVVGLFFDRYLESQRRAAPLPDSGVAVDAPADTQVTDQFLEEQVSKIRANVQAAAALGAPVLSEEIRFELDHLVVDSRHWSRGELNVSVERYRMVLFRLYREANETIFSTTIRDFLVGWQDELMDGMIAASEQSAAKEVVRVFVFAKRDEIDERAVQVLRRFEASRVRPLVYIDQEDEKFNFPPDVSRDFVVIDGGDAIGVTMSYGAGSLRAQWYFDDEARTPLFQNICDSLESASLPAKEIITWWEARQKADGGDDESGKHG